MRTREELREVVLRVLGRIAPEADLKALGPAESLREELDIDSVDFLNFMIGLNAELGVEIPEADARKLSSLEDCISYLLSNAESR
ncbi:MAG: acyl carrier protein [Deltaproteobacteria bacterium]|nr:acyl carrier protein [Deltaproteobacteria bacterium]